MKNLINRVDYVLNGEDGASNVEIIVWFSVVFVIATALFLFKDSVTTFIEKINTKIGNLDTIGAGSASNGSGTGRV